MPKSHDENPSLSTDVERAIKSGIPLPRTEEEKHDLKRVNEDARQHAEALERARERGWTEPARAYKNILFTQKQIDYLLVILKPYASPIAEEIKCKLESAP